MKSIKYIAQDILMDVGICTNANFGYGSFGEFEHSRKLRAYKLAGFATLIIAIIFIIRNR